MRLSAVAEAGQVGLSMAETAGAAGLAHMNRAYRERFGFPFTVCVSRTTAVDVLRTLARRLEHEPGAELAATIDEVRHITRLRMLAHVSGPELFGRW